MNTATDNQPMNVRTTQILAIIACVLAGFGVFWGQRAELAADGGLSSWLIPIATSVALIVLLSGAWHMLLKMAVMKDGPAIELVLSMGITATIVAIATSSWFLTSAIGGPTALRHHMNTQVAEFEDTTRLIRNEAEREIEIHQAVRAAKGTAEETARCELLDGCVTLIPGPGPTVNELNRAAKAIGQVETEMSTLIETRTSTLDNAEEKLRQAQKAILDADEQAFAEAMSAGVSLLGEAERMSVVNLASSLAIGQTGVGPLSDILGQIALVVRKVSRQKTSIDIPTWERMSRSEATIAYSERISLAWIVAISLDTLPLLLLVITIVMARQREANVFWLRNRPWPQSAGQ